MRDAMRELWLWLANTVLGGALGTIVTPILTLYLILRFLRWATATARGQKDMETLEEDIQIGAEGLQNRARYGRSYRLLRRSGLSDSDLGRARRQRPGDRFRFVWLLPVGGLLLLGALAGGGAARVEAQGSNCIDYTLVPNEFVQLTFETRGFLYYTGPAGSYVDVFLNPTDQFADDVIFRETWVDYSWIGSGTRHVRIAESATNGTLRACESMAAPTATPTATLTPTVIVTPTATMTATLPPPTATLTPTVSTPTQTATGVPSPTATFQPVAKPYVVYLPHTRRGINSR